MTHQLVCPINLSVTADWARIKTVYNQLIQQKNQGIFPRTSAPSYTADRYDIGSFGSIISSTSLTDGAVWDVWGGLLLESLLPPDLIQLKQDIQDAGLNFINFNYFQHTGNVNLHTDGKKLNEAPNGHCNINYIITATDPNACTTVYKNTRFGYCESYGGTGNWWLINTATLHQVKNSGFREVFQIKIFDSFDRIKDFFVQRDQAPQ